MPFRLKPKTVDAAIAPLLKAIVDLDGVAEARSEALARDGEEIGRLETRMQVDQAELTLAKAVAKSIRNITSPANEVWAKEAKDNDGI